jgi:hypothetical protein
VLLWLLLLLLLLLWGSDLLHRFPGCCWCCRNDTHAPGSTCSS